MIASWVSIFKSWILSKPLKWDCGGHGQKTGHIWLFLQWCDVAQIVFLLQSRLMSFQIGLPPAGASGLVTNRMLHSLMGSHSLLQSSQPGFHAWFFFLLSIFCCLLQIRIGPVDKSDCPPHLFFFRNEVRVHVLLWDVACVEAPRWNCFDKQQVRGIMVWPHGLVCHVMSRVLEKWFCACVCKI